MNVETTPSGAVLSIDGAEIGSTPQTPTRPVGTRLVLLMQLRGYKPESHEITVDAGGFAYRYELERRTRHEPNAKRDPRDLTDVDV